MSLTSDENKSVLWQVLANHPGMRSDSAQFRDRFERTLEEVQRSAAARGAAADLTELNKQVILGLSRPEQRAPAQKARTGVREERTAERELFSRQLERQQKDLAATLAPPKPKDIDFRELEDWRPVATMDATIAKRQADLTSITAEYNEAGAKKWIGVADQKGSDSLRIDRASEVSLKVTELQQASADGGNGRQPRRRVRFAGAEDADIGLLAKLKRKTSDIDILRSMQTDMKAILQNQREILRRLGPGPQELLPSSTL